MRKVIYALAFFLALSAGTIPAQKKAFAIEDLYKIHSVGAPVISPDGKLIAFTVTNYDLPKGKSMTDIYVMDLDGNNKKKVTDNGKSNNNPLWTSDSKGLYFVSTASGTPQVYLYTFAGKESKKITDFSMGVNSPVLSPDNKLIAFSSEVYPECGADSKKNALTDSLAVNGPVQAYVADKLLFRHWTDYAAGKASHIILYNVQAQTYTDLTPDKFVSPVFMLGGGIGYNFSPDSKELCYVSNHDAHPEASTNADLFIVPVTGGEAVNITAGNKAWDGSPTYSPDGKYIAYRKQLIPGYESDLFRLALYNRQTKETKMISESFDNWVNDYKWNAGSNSIYFQGEVLGNEPIYKIDIASKKITPVSGEKAILGFDLDTKGYVYYLASSVGKPGELYRMKLSDKKETQLTALNLELENTVDIRPADTLWVAGADGRKQEVFLVKPHDFDPNKKYPLVLNVHGGPQSQWMNSFRGDWQVYPGAGYVLAFANPHGSTGYGQDYTSEISGDWGGKPFTDLMKVTDRLANLSYVDSTRMGAMGWSYGGYMMNWFQAKTKRFKCLASMMGLYDLRSMWGTTEELWFPNFDLKGQPWNSDLYKKFSPSEYVKNFATPTLIVTGQLDFRVSYTQSIQYFSTLQTLGIPSRLIILKNDGHWPSNVKSMPLYYDAHLDWFHKYLGGEPAPYDVDKLVKNQAFNEN
ncbi:MAG: S9 family peptidase [Bacteroidota bacterium]|nr:S9 family peptidase [Bacteroidota bacterium]